MIPLQTKIKSSKLEGSSEDECSDDTEDESSDVSDDGNHIYIIDLLLDSSVGKSNKKGRRKRVTETVSKTANITKIPQNQNNTSTNTQPPKLKTRKRFKGTTLLNDYIREYIEEVNELLKSPTLGPGLTSALQNLKSTVNKLPRLSTLEKSRLDWKQYVQKESLEDDLKAHNKGKDG
ncbi:unnamed protein product [Trichobilharzia regenti]|nr:unnamed protein product [Trichobilharzia regenti]